jgi:hypothetical protein
MQDPTRYLKLTLLLLFVPAITFAGQQPGVPLSNEWLVIPCETWNCAASALVLAAGDQYVMSMPTKSDKFPWIVIRRVPSGSFYVPPDAPFVLESFDSAGDGSARFAAITTDHGPMMLTAPDGKALVISLRAALPRRPAAGR